MHSILDELVSVQASYIAPLSPTQQVFPVHIWGSTLTVSAKLILCFSDGRDGLQQELSMATWQNNTVMFMNSANPVAALDGGRSVG